MDVLNKLRNTVSSTVYQLSGVLPGNPVTREFEVIRHIASCGPGLLWKIYSGSKKSTKQEAAIFVFEKKVLDKYSKHDRDIILDVLKKGVSQLTRLRHPKILTVQHPLEESRESLAFATEPVFASLANVLGQHDNMPSPIPTDLKDYRLYEVEIKYGILQLAESLTFLHNDVKLLHRNICPESILINKCGAWKISGFEFCIMNCNSPDKAPSWEFHEWEPELPIYAQPNLDFLAPEYALTLSCDTSSDMFSLGVLIYTIFNEGRLLFGNCGNFVTFKQNSCELKCLPSSILNAIPNELKEYIKMLLNVTPEVRPDAHQFTKISFFEDVGAKTLQYLDSLFQWDNLQKSQFYKGLPAVINKMPKRVNLHRILPCLLNEFPNIDMVPFVLPNVLLVAEDTTQAEFQKLILPGLKNVFKIQEPIQIILIFLQNMELLLSKTPAEDVRNHVLPMIYSALESNAQPIQELCLNIIPSFASLVEYPTMKNALLPRIKKLCLSTPFLSVRVNCLICIGKLLEHLDKWLVLDDILPILPEISSKEPAVLMGILGIYKLTMSNKKLGITKEIMATKVLPFLVPLSIENGLTLNQFNAIMGLIKEMMQQVETEHRGKLEQLNSIQQEQKSALEMSKVQVGKKDELISGLSMKPITEMDTMFQGLGLGNFLEEKDICKVASGMLSPVGDGPDKKMSSTQSKHSLTLEEKQRLVHEQEHQQRLKSQQSLNVGPKKSPSSPTIAAVPPRTTNKSMSASSRDLTDSLIRSNLSIIGKPPAMVQPNPGMQANYNISSGTMFMPSFPNQPTPPTSISMNPVGMGMMGQPIGATGFQSTINWPGQPGNPTMMIAPYPRLPLQRPDLSAFDKLLPSASAVGASNSVSKMSLHQMAQNSYGNGQATPTASKMTSPNAKTPGSLSQSDITDLLG